MTVSFTILILVCDARNDCVIIAFLKEIDCKFFLLFVCIFIYRMIYTYIYIIIYISSLSLSVSVFFSGIFQLTVYDGVGHGDGRRGEGRGLQL